MQYRVTQCVVVLVGVGAMFALALAILRSEPSHVLNIVTGQTRPDKNAFDMSAEVSTADWIEFEVDWKTFPVDLSFLNERERPAGKRGFVRVENDRLMFEDGTVARFWGTNLTSFALFGTSQKGVPEQARRLSKMGFNLVRFHHHDSHWAVPNIFGDKSVPDTQSLDSAMLERLDWWIACLKNEGIYVWLDLHVGRRFKPADGIEAFEEISKDGTNADPRGYNYVNDSIREAMKRFNEAYVTHRNQYTGLRYRDDPAIVAMLVTNENDVTHHFGSLLLPDRNVPVHTERYMRRANAFADAHQLPRRKVWRAWEHGPSKLFLNDLEYRFHSDIIRHLRVLGVRVPIVTTSQWGSNPLSSLPALTAGDLIDAHAYGGLNELNRNPLNEPTFVHWLGAAQVAGRPLTVTEWNVEPFPAPDRHSMPMYVAATASHQGWSAVMQYAYAEVPLDGPGSPSNWHAYNDPGLLGTLPAAALMFRGRHIKPATTTYVFEPTTEQLFYEPISPQNSVALRTAMERGRLITAMPETRELPWLRRSAIPSEAVVITDFRESLLHDNATMAESDTGELRRNWNLGIFEIDTPQTQGATGRIGGRTSKLSDVEFEITTSHATVVVQSMDGNAIRSSRRIMITLGGRSLLSEPDQLPFVSEPILGQIRVRALAGLNLQRNDFTGTSEQKGVLYRDGHYHIDLTSDIQPMWLMLEQVGGAPSAGSSASK